jgi:hypothetical protein
MSIKIIKINNIPVVLYKLSSVTDISEPRITFNILLDINTLRLYLPVTCGKVRAGRLCIPYFNRTRTKGLNGVDTDSKRLIFDIYWPFTASFENFSGNLMILNGKGEHHHRYAVDEEVNPHKKSYYE